ncbi:MAG: gamma carbonic anhydrase family protein [Chthoniobacterales bacterium]|nr:gamma carbonic anhydrase family protein [Chthoniobacterales bacterium]
MTIDERLEKFLSRQPQLDQAAFIAKDARIMGDVRLGKSASVFYGCVLRGDIESILVGEGSNVQDGTIIHLADDLSAIVGAYCTIGHGAIIHACRVGDECLVGMRAVVLDGAEIGDQCLIAAGSVVTPRTKIPAGSLVMGTPGKVVRQLTTEERQGLRVWAEKYLHVARAHASLQAAASAPTSRDGK